MKKIKKLLILSAVLLALVLVYVLASPLWTEQKDETTTEEPEQTVAVIDHNKLSGFELTVRGEKETNKLVFSLNSDGTAWLWSENSEIPLDNNVFAMAIKAITDATSSHKLENVTADDLVKYGLDTPSFKLKLTFEDGSVKEFNVGDLNNFNSRRYFSESGEPNTVFMVEDSVTEALALNIYDFVLAEVPPKVTEGKLVSLEYLSPESERKSFVYYPSGNDKDYTDKYNWYYSFGEVASAPLNRDIAKVLTELMTSISFDECVGFDCTEEQYGFSESRKLTLTYNVDEGETGVLTEKTYVVYIGKQTESGEIYAHTESSKLVYLISDADDWVKIVNGTQKDFITSEIWLPNYERIDRLTFKLGDKTLVLDVKTTDGKVSFTSSPEISADKTEELLSALAALKATSHTSVLESNDPPEKKTYFEVEVKFNSGDTAQGTITVETYTEKYCRVSFMGNTERLITTEDAEKLADLLGLIFVDGEKAE